MNLCMNMSSSYVMWDPLQGIVCHTSQVKDASPTLSLFLIYKPSMISSMLFLPAPTLIFWLEPNNERSDTSQVGSRPWWEWRSDQKKSSYQTVPASSQEVLPLSVQKPTYLHCYLLLINLKAGLNPRCSSLDSKFLIRQNSYWNRRRFHLSKNLSNCPSISVHDYCKRVDFFRNSMKNI